MSLTNTQVIIITQILVMTHDVGIRRQQRKIILYEEEK
jgi:hypothetical protein